jgi:hypothetical protein
MLHYLGFHATVCATNAILPLCSSFCFIADCSAASLLFVCLVCFFAMIALCYSWAFGFSVFVFSTATLSLCQIRFRRFHFLCAAFASDAIGCVDSYSTFGFLVAFPLSLYLFWSPVALSAILSVPLSLSLSVFSLSLSAQSSLGTFASDSIGCVDSYSTFGFLVAFPLSLYLFWLPVALSAILSVPLSLSLSVFSLCVAFASDSVF